jgi:hypothetical protein
MSLLVIAEHDNAVLKTATLNAVTAAVKIGGEIHILVAGAGCGAVAEQAAKVAGVAKVRVADAAHYGDQTAENLAALIVANAAGYSHILAPATSNGKNTLPRVAALLDVAQISEIISVVDADTFVRPIYAGNALATVKSSDATKVITVRTTGFDARELGRFCRGRGTGRRCRPGPVETAGPRTDQVGAAGTRRGQDHRLRRPRHGQRRELPQGAGTAGRQAGRGHGRFARRGRCRLRAQRLPGRPDRQDRRAAAVHRDRHFGCDPAPGRHEGFQGDRGDQQGSG